MATIEKVVKTWDNDPDNKNRQVEIQPPLKCKKYTTSSDGKVAEGNRAGKINKWALIRLSEGVAPFDNSKPENPDNCYYSQQCYIFDFPDSGIPKIGFYRRKKAACNRSRIEKNLASFHGQKIKGKPLIFEETKFDTLMLRIKFDENDKNLPAQDICDYMKEFIDLTQKSI